MSSSTVKPKLPEVSSRKKWFNFNTGSILNADGKHAKKFWYGSLGGMLVFTLAVGLILSRKDGTWDVDPKSDDDEKNNRQKRRGTIASILVSLSFSTLNSIVDKYGKVDASTSTALFGYILGGTLGFLADQGLGTDQGLRVFKEQGMFAGMDYIFGSLYSGKYMRYGITVLLDMFISVMIFVKMFSWAKDGSSFLKENSWIANGICSALIGLVTFQAYTNQTRFLWAYPDPKSKSKATWMKSSTVLTITTVSAVAFMMADTGSDGLNNVNVKMAIVMVTLGIMTMLSLFDHLDPQLEYETHLIHCSDEINSKASSMVEKIKKCANSDPEKDKTTGCTDAMRLAALDTKSFKSWQKDLDEITTCYGAKPHEIRTNLVINTGASTSDIISRHLQGRFMFVLIATMVWFGTFSTSQAKSLKLKKLFPVVMVLFTCGVTFGPFVMNVAKKVNNGVPFMEAVMGSGEDKKAVNSDQKHKKELISVVNNSEKDKGVDAVKHVKKAVAEALQNDTATATKIKNLTYEINELKTLAKEHDVMMKKYAQQQQNLQQPSTTTTQNSLLQADMETRTTTTASGGTTFNVKNNQNMPELKPAVSFNSEPDSDFTALFTSVYSE